MIFVSKKENYCSFTCMHYNMVEVSLLLYCTKLGDFFLQLTKGALFFRLEVL